MPVESASVTLGGKPCLDPFTALAEASRLGIPVDSWIDRANSFTCPLGPAPGRGWVLMLSKDVDSLNREDFLELVFATTDSQAVLKGLVFVKAIAIFPRTEFDGDSIFLVELADRRLLCQMTYMNDQYNVLSPNPDDDFHEWSLDGGTSEWTWQTIIDDIWINLPVMGLVAPTLPANPVVDFIGNPNNFRFIGVSAWDALTAVLDAIGCAIQLDLLANEVFIGQRGDVSDGDFTNAVASNRNRLLYDTATITSKLGTLPGTCRVFFNAQDWSIGSNGSLTPQDQFEYRPAYNVEVPIPSDENGNAGGGHPASIQVIWGDTIALYDGNSSTPINATELQARAEEITFEYMNSLEAGGQFLHFVYSGALTDFVPQADVTAVRWRCCAGRGIFSGMTTEVIRQPRLMADVDDFPKPGQWPTPAAYDARTPPTLSRARMPSFRVICFELTAVLEIGGSATAKIKKFDGAEWRDSGVTTTVWDFVRIQNATNSVAVGRRGLAFLHHQAGPGGVQSGRYIVFAYECPPSP